MYVQHGQQMLVALEESLISVGETMSKQNTEVNDKEKKDWQMNREALNGLEVKHNHNRPR